jgi:hypothetical protein
VFLDCFKSLTKRSQKLKGATLKIYRTLLVFDKVAIIPMVRWSFLRAGFRLNPDNLLDPLTVIPSQVLNRIATLEMTLADYFFLRVLKFQCKQKGLDAD